MTVPCKIYGIFLNEGIGIDPKIILGFQCKFKGYSIIIIIRVPMKI